MMSYLPPKPGAFGDRHARFAWPQHRAVERSEHAPFQGIESLRTPVTRAAQGHIDKLVNAAGPRRHHHNLRPKRDSFVHVVGDH